MISPTREDQAGYGLLDVYELHLRAQRLGDEADATSDKDGLYVARRAHLRAATDARLAEAIRLLMIARDRNEAWDEIAALLNAASESIEAARQTAFRR